MTHAAALAALTIPPPVRREAPDARRGRREEVRASDPVSPPSPAFALARGHERAEAGREPRSLSPSSTDTTSASATPLTLEIQEVEPGDAPAMARGARLVVAPARDAPLRARVGRPGARRDAELRPGDVALVPADAEGAWEWREPGHAVLIRIHPEAARGLIAPGLGREPGPLAAASRAGEALVLRDCALAAIAGRMAGLVERGGSGAGVQFEALATALLALLGGEGAEAGGLEDGPVSSPGPAPAPPLGPDLPPERRRALEGFIEANLGRRIAASELAAAAGMSVTALGRALRVSGVTPMGLVARRRDERARAMVEAGGHSLGRIAAACGYADQAHLTRRFRAAFGRTPGAHRAERRRTAEVAAAREAAEGGPAAGGAAP